MNVRQLREALEEAAGIFAAAGAKSQKDSIDAFLQIFDGHDDESVSDFLAALRLRLKGDVDWYTQRLREAGTDKAAFDVVFAELSDRYISKDAIEAIARQYTGGRTQWRTKGEALNEIKTRFRERAYQAVKMRQVDKASRW